MTTWQRPEQNGTHRNRAPHRAEVQTSASLKFQLFMESTCSHGSASRAMQ
jgi:hypothetical protein